MAVQGAKILIIALSIASVQASGGVSSFSYGVSDPTTGDVKSQHEKRVGETVVGQYSLLEPDGTKRVVEYSSNPQTGFKAVVKKDPLALHSAQAYQGLGYAGYFGPGFGVYSGYGAHSALGYEAHSIPAYGAHSVVRYGAHSGYGAHSTLNYGTHSGHGAHSALNYGSHSALGYGYPHNVGYTALSPLAYSSYSASPLTYGSYAPAVSYSTSINHGGYAAPYAHGFAYGAGYGKYGASGWSNGVGYGVHGLGWQ